MTDLVRLIRSAGCDALRPGLAPTERALLCSGPGSTVRLVAPATRECTSYGPRDREAALHRIRRRLAWAEAGGSSRPGDRLLSPPGSRP